MYDVLDHDVLQGEEGEVWPVSEDAGVEAAGIVATQEHCLEVGTAVGDGGQLLVRGSSVEYLCELGLCSLLISKHLFEPRGSKHQVSQAVDFWTSLQHHTSTISLHLAR